jgi:nitrogen fixation NifU-like protein
MSGSGLDSMYQEIIMDHARHPHGVGLRESSSGQSHQINPTCGDEITLQVHRGAGDVIESVTWEGHGCAISQASASLLSDLVQNVATEDAVTRIAAFRELMRSRGTLEGDEDLLGDAVVLGGVSRYVARVKCAMLSWVAFEDALRQSHA